MILILFIVFFALLLMLTGAAGITWYILKHNRDTHDQGTPSKCAAIPGCKQCSRLNCHTCMARYRDALGKCIPVLYGGWVNQVPDVLKNFLPTNMTYMVMNTNGHPSDGMIKFLKKWKAAPRVFLPSWNSPNGDGSWKAIEAQLFAKPSAALSAYFQALQDEGVPVDGLMVNYEPEDGIGRLVDGDRLEKVEALVKAMNDAPFRGDRNILAFSFAEQAWYDTPPKDGTRPLSTKLLGVLKSWIAKYQNVYLLFEKQYYVPNQPLDKLTSHIIDTANQIRAVVGQENMAHFYEVYTSANRVVVTQALGTVLQVGFAGLGYWLLSNSDKPQEVQQMVAGTDAYLPTMTSS